MPVDPYPDPDGNVYARRSAGQLLGHVAHDGEQLPTGWRVYMLHFATCSNAPAPKEPEPTPEPELTLFDNQPGGTNE